ncbi:uridine diphosphate-N-acetylglucosamine-binding protein YvcK [Pseudoalteromonas sp. CO302Y]|uniref:gluconeogenesis factor YvcK family protein n=1 Tax=unclassified Pseudoalteromonas TaxID=194690 RepID=UPI00102322BD|nr:uridine diphosphate-N-acetylglucosamine-binding protein YvcK [Pseudoalteromonas sp. CO302Y]RZG10794.1 uridine diphosphate-N-acetylglucosamine-binding protein YvcK [Pseudoalteromonas sp. CO133X]
MKIVCIGGGHGLSHMLSAIRPHCADLTAIVATTDNGGSTGKLRQSQDVVALGDIRRCCLQLADSDSLIHQVFHHRFDGGELNGHSLGNLALLSLTEQTNSATQAVAWFNAMLGNSETILPMSDEPTDLLAVMSSGIKVFGECEIDSQKELPDYVTLSQDVNAAPGVVQAIENADMLIIGPGSLITSVMPAMLVEDIAKAVQKTSACRVFIENIAKEASVIKSLDMKPVDWLEGMLGYSFCDLSISLDALSEIVSHFDDVVKSPNQQHDIEQLSNVFGEILKMPLSLEAEQLVSSNQALRVS